METMSALQELEKLSGSLPLALKHSHIVRLFDRCGLGGDAEYRRQKKKGALVPLRGVQGAKHPRYSKAQVVAMCAEALQETSPPTS